MICFLCSPLLAIWTSPKSNMSMVNWLSDCRFDLDSVENDSVAGPDKIQQKTKNLLQAWLVHARPTN